MDDDDVALLGPYFSKLPTELALDIALTLCFSSQSSYANLLLVCRTFRDLCRVPCLRVVPVVLETPDKSALFADYLRTQHDVAPLIRRLWIVKDHHHILPQCTNLVSLACDGHDLTSITSSEHFKHTQLIDLTIMGLWYFWAPFVKSKHGRTLCGQLHKLWLLDHLFLRGIGTDWWSSLRELYYWSIKGSDSRNQFEDELILLKALPRLERFGIIMRSPSPLVLKQSQLVGDKRLEIITWGQKVEIVEWINQRM